MLTLELDRKSLAAALSRVNGVTYKKCARELLTNCLLTVKNGLLSIIANNVENYLVETMPAPGAIDQAAVTVNPHNLAAVLKNTKAANIVCQITSAAVIANGATTPACSVSDDAAAFFADSHFSQLQTVAIAKLQACELRGALLRANAATDTESSRYALGGVRFELDPTPAGATFARFVGTDGRRLSVTTISSEAVPNTAAAVGAIVDRKTVERVAVLLKTAQTAVVELLNATPIDSANLRPWIHDNASAVRVSAFDKTGALVSVITTRVIDGRYPNWAQVIESGNRSKVAEFNPDSLLPHIRGAGIGADEENQAFKLFCRPGLPGLAVSKRNKATGFKYSQRTAAVTVGRFIASLDWRYVRDILATADCKTVELCAENSIDAVSFSGVVSDVQQWQALLMPFNRERCRQDKAAKKTSKSRKR